MLALLTDKQNPSLADTYLTRGHISKIQIYPGLKVLGIQSLFYILD